MKTHNEALLERVAEVMRPYLPPTRTDLLRNAVRAAIEALPARDEAAPASGVEAHPSMQTFDEGIDFALDRLCGFLGVDPAAVTWDAATETIEGDVSSVIGNILRAKFGEDWGPSAALASSTSAESAGGGVQFPPRPSGHVSIAHDGFAGDIIGHYETREGKRGVVVQQDGTRVVHVYGEKWLTETDATRARGQ